MSFACLHTCKWRWQYNRWNSRNNPTTVCIQTRHCRRLIPVKYLFVIPHRAKWMKDHVSLSIWINFCFISSALTLSNVADILTYTLDTNRDTRRHARTQKSRNSRTKQIHWNIHGYPFPCFPCFQFEWNAHDRH